MNKILKNSFLVLAFIFSACSASRIPPEIFLPELLEESATTAAPELMISVPTVEDARINEELGEVRGKKVRAFSSPTFSVRRGIERTLRNAGIQVTDRAKSRMDVRLIEWTVRDSEDGIISTSRIEIVLRDSYGTAQYTGRYKGESQQQTMRVREKELQEVLRSSMEEAIRGIGEDAQVKAHSR